MIQSFSAQSLPINHSLQYLLAKNQSKIESYQVKHKPAYSQHAFMSEYNSHDRIFLIDKSNSQKSVFSSTPTSKSLQVPQTKKNLQQQKDVHMREINQNKLWTSGNKMFDIQRKEKSKFVNVELSQLISTSQQTISISQQTRPSLMTSPNKLHESPNKNLTQNSRIRTLICQNCSQDYNNLASVSKSDQELKIKKIKTKFEQQIDSLQQDLAKNIQQSQRHLDSNISSALQTAKQENNILKIERNLYQKKHHDSIQQMTRDMELQRKQSNNDVEKLENDKKGVEKCVVEVEQLVTKMLIENQSSKLKTEDIYKAASNVADEQQDGMVRSMEIKDTIMDIKSLIDQLISLFFCITEGRTPPLELILAQHKNRSSLMHEHLKIESNDIWVSMQKIIKKDTSFKIQIQASLIQLTDHIRSTIQIYQQKFISDIGGYK